MTNRPYIIYPDKAVPLTDDGLEVAIKRYINEPGLVSFGVVDFVPGWYVAPHRHHIWELIIIDNSSEEPGYIFFDNLWWRTDPGCGVFLPKGSTHGWSAGNKKGFKMLWIYPGTHEEAGRIYHGDPDDFHAITPEEERSALVWTEEKARAIKNK